MRRALLALLFVAACSDDEGPIIDAPVGDGSDGNDLDLHAP